MSSDVFSYGGVALYAVVGDWPVLSNPIIYHSKTRDNIILSEVERRQQYLDKMIGEAEVLRRLVEECLDDDPAVRPTMEVVSERIKQVITIYQPGAEVTSVHLSHGYWVATWRLKYRH